MFASLRRRRRIERTNWSATTRAKARAKTTTVPACHAPSRSAKRSPSRCRWRRCWARGLSSDRTAAARSVLPLREPTNQALLHQTAPSVAHCQRWTHPFMLGEPGDADESSAGRWSPSRRAASVPAAQSLADACCAVAEARLSAGRASGVERGIRSSRSHRHGTRSADLSDARRRAAAQSPRRPRQSAQWRHAPLTARARQTALGERLITLGSRGVATRSPVGSVLASSRVEGPRAGSGARQSRRNGGQPAGAARLCVGACLVSADRCRRVGSLRAAVTLLATLQETEEW